MTMKLSNLYVNNAEEQIISDRGCGVIYFAGCPMHCLYCNQHKYSQGGAGIPVTPAQFADMLLVLQNKGCSHISIANICDSLDEFEQSVELARQKGFCTKLLLNSSGYEKPEEYERLFHLFDGWVIDFKYSSDALGKELSGVDDYFTRFKSLVKPLTKYYGMNVEKKEQLVRGLIIRHLILPGYEENSRGVVDFIASTKLKKYPVSFLIDYVPEYQAFSHPTLSHCARKTDTMAITHYATRKGLQLI